MVADRETVLDRLTRIRRYVADLRLFARIAAADFRQNRERQYAVLHALQLAIEACLEIATHICAADALGVPASYAEAFGLLEQGSTIPPALAEQMRAMARFRNRIVHAYWDVDTDVVYTILQDRIGDFDAYVAAINRYLGQVE